MDPPLDTLLADRIAAEFEQQAALERARGLPVTAMDASTPLKLAALQASEFGCFAVLRCAGGGGGKQRKVAVFNASSLCSFGLACLVGSPVSPFPPRASGRVCCFHCETRVGGAGGGGAGHDGRVPQPGGAYAPGRAPKQACTQHAPACLCYPRASVLGCAVALPASATVSVRLADDLAPTKLPCSSTSCIGTQQERSMTRWADRKTHETLAAEQQQGKVAKLQHA